MPGQVNLITLFELSIRFEVLDSKLRYLKTLSFISVFACISIRSNSYQSTFCLLYFIKLKAKTFTMWFSRHKTASTA